MRVLVVGRAIVRAGRLAEKNGFAWKNTSPLRARLKLSRALPPGSSFTSPRSTWSRVQAACSKLVDADDDHPKQSNQNEPPPNRVRGAGIMWDRRCVEGTGRRIAVFSSNLTGRQCSACKTQVSISGPAVFIS